MHHRGDADAVTTSSGLVSNKLKGASELQSVLDLVYPSGPANDAQDTSHPNCHRSWQAKLHQCIADNACIHKVQGILQRAWQFARLVCGHGTVPGWGAGLTHNSST